MMDFAVAAVEGALAAGARYADARAMTISTEPMSAQNGAIESLRQEERAGVGVRALIGSSWGFSATTELSTRGPHKTGGQAAMTSRASAPVPGPPLDLPPVAAVTDHWESQLSRGPTLGAALGEGRPLDCPDHSRPRRHRILGWEAAFAGTSWLDLSQLGTLRWGSPLMQVTADATLPGALGSFAYEDEGTLAHSVDIVRDGTWWVGVLSSRDTAALAGVPNGGMVRADGHDRIPMVRMTNIGLLPRQHSLEQMIAETDDGIFMDTNRSWSIDDRRLNFQFGCQVAWEVKNGSLGRMLRNPTYTGISPEFWGSLDMVGSPAEWRFWGTPNCGKGQPLQIGHTGHPAVPCRFRNVRTGVRG